MPRGHRQLEHTADLAFEVWAENEPDLLAEAALALVDCLTEGAPPLGAPLEERAITLEAIDREDRLVRFLNEVIYLAVSEGFLVRGFRIELTGEAVHGLRRQGHQPPIGALLELVHPQHVEHPASVRRLRQRSRCRASVMACFRHC